MDILFMDKSEYLNAALAFDDDSDRVKLLSSLELSLFNCHSGEIVDGKFDFTLTNPALGTLLKPHYDRICSDVSKIIRGKRLKGSTVFNDLSLHRVYVFSLIIQMNDLTKAILCGVSELDDLGDNDVNVRDDLGFVVASKKYSKPLVSASKKELISKHVNETRDILKGVCTYIRYLKEQEEQGNYRFLIRDIC